MKWEAWVEQEGKIVFRTALYEQVYKEAQEPLLRKISLLESYIRELEGESEGPGELLERAIASIK